MDPVKDYRNGAGAGGEMDWRKKARMETAFNPVWPRFGGVSYFSEKAFTVCRWFQRIG